MNLFDTLNETFGANRGWFTQSNEVKQVFGKKVTRVSNQAGRDYKEMVFELENCVGLVVARPDIDGSWRVFTRRRGRVA